VSDYVDILLGILNVGSHINSILELTSMVPSIYRTTRDEAAALMVSSGIPHKLHLDVKIFVKQCAVCQQAKHELCPWITSTLTHS
jgi:hypothetical protein